MADGGEVRLGRDGVAVGWVYVGLLAAAIAGFCVLAVVDRQLWLVVVSALPVPVMVLTALLLKLTRLGTDELVLTDDGVLARTRGEVRRWAWGDLLEITISRIDATGPYTSQGCTVWIRPEGGTFDVPGPNAPFPVTIPVFGFGAHRRVGAVLERACAQHDIPFDRHGLRTAGQPRPDSPWRTRPAKRAAAPTEERT